MSRFFAIFGLFGPFLAPFGRDQIKNCRPENVFQNARSFTRSRSSASSSRVENSSLDRASKRDDGNTNETMTIALGVVLSHISSPSSFLNDYVFPVPCGRTRLRSPLLTSRRRARRR